MEVGRLGNLNPKPICELRPGSESVVQNTSRIRNPKFTVRTFPGSDCESGVHSHRVINPDFRILPWTKTL